MKVVLLFSLLASLLIVSACVPNAKGATDAEIANAIEKGLTWLAERQNADGSWGSTDKVGKTGLAVLKFETYALEHKIDPLDSGFKYYSNVVNGLNYIMSRAYYINIANQPAGDPDTNGNGKGVYIYYDSGHRMYETGIAAMAIAASTHPENVVSNPLSAMNGRTYKEVLTDVVDYFAFGQVDLGAATRGGWRYYENYGSADNSITGYVVLGLVYANSDEFGFKCAIPQFVKSELNLFVDYIQTDVTGGSNDGGSGYDAPNYWVNILKTGNLLQEMAFLGDAVTAVRVQAAIDYIVRHWNDQDYIGWKGYATNYACYQAMYTTMKGLTAFGIDFIGGIDWYSDFVNELLSEQSADGGWPAAPLFGNQWGGIWSYDSSDRILSTTWALLVLEKAAPQIFYAIESCNAAGVKTDSFSPSQTVYVKGSGYAPSTIYNLYIVPDKSTWTEGDVIPARVPGTATTVTSDADGNIPVTAVWNAPLNVGKFDIVVDVNGNGQYDAYEPLDNNDVVGTAGFLVIPEFWLGALIGLAGCFAAFSTFHMTKRKHH